jgi:hypothetical protein
VFKRGDEITLNSVVISEAEFEWIAADILSAMDNDSDATAPEQERVAAFLECLRPSSDKSVES